LSPSTQTSISNTRCWPKLKATALESRNRAFLVAIVFLVAASLALLVVARFMQGSGWLWALLGTLAGASLTCGILLGALVRVLLGSPLWMAVSSAILSCAALFLRSTLVAQIHAEPGFLPEVGVTNLTFATSTITWSLLGLLWGIQALATAFRGPAQRTANTLLAGAAVSGAFYCLGPLWQLLGLRISAVTFLALCGLATVAYALGALVRRYRPS